MRLKSECVEDLTHFTVLQMLPYDQALFAGLLGIIYFTSTALTRKNVQLLQHRLFPLTRLNAGMELHVLQPLFCLLAGLPIFGYEAMLATLLCAVALWAVHKFIPAAGATIVTWIGMFSWLTWLNLTRPNEWTIHISGSIMLMTIRFTSHAGDVRNGFVTTGSLIEWLGWTYFIPSFFTGPTMSLQDYREWHSYLTVPEVDERAHPHPPSPQQQQQGEQINIEATRPPNRAFVRALWYAPFVIVGQTAFPVLGVTRFLPTDGMLYRIFYAWMALWCIKCRYYLAWGVAEAAFAASEASRFVWHRGRNVDVWNVELGRSTHSVLKYWNMCTADWLKRYVYIPVRGWLGEGNYRAPDLCAIVATNVVSALWHGLAPGYYATFVGGGVCTAVGRLLHTYVDPYVTASGSLVLQNLYEVLMVLWTAVLVITFGLPFQLFSWSLTWEAWKGLFFIGHTWLGGALMLVLLTMVVSARSEGYQIKKDV